jgi:hypothetical protein
MDNDPAVAAIKSREHSGSTKYLGNKVYGTYDHVVENNVEFEHADGKTNPMDVLTKHRCGVRALLCLR